MARFSPDHTPVYRHSKRTGRASVRISGKDHYLGIHSDAAESTSRRKYNRLISEWFAANQNPLAFDIQRQAAATPTGPTIDDVIAAFWLHAQTYYRDKDGNPTSEIKNLFYDLRLLRRLFGDTYAAVFDSAGLEACQQTLIRQGITRKSINRRINRIRHVFRWAVSKKLVPLAVHQSLKTLDGLKIGRTAAKEKPPVKPVSEAHVQAVRVHASRHISAMIELQLVTGMRPGEMVIMRTGDIDRAGKVWTYTPTKHKTEYLGHKRVVYLGARAQEIITPFLKLDPTAFIFSPADATAERRAHRASDRKTPMSCGNRAGTNRKKKPSRTPGLKYTRESYAKAIQTACRRAFPPPAEMIDPNEIKAWHAQHHFHPHQLRHTAGTTVRREFGLDAVQAVLG